MAMILPTDGLDRVRAGDTVAMLEAHYYDSPDFLVTRTVEKVTATQITVSGGVRFMRRTGRQVGQGGRRPYRGYGWREAQIAVITPELHEQIERDLTAQVKWRRWKEALSLVQNCYWERVSFATLVAVVELLEKEWEEASAVATAGGKAEPWNG